MAARSSSAGGKKPKRFIAFNEESRRDFLLGFRKRKAARRKKAVQDKEKLLKERRRASHEKVKQQREEQNSTMLIQQKQIDKFFSQKGDQNAAKGKSKLARGGKNREQGLAVLGQAANTENDQTERITISHALNNEATSQPDAFSIVTTTSDVDAFY